MTTENNVPADANAESSASGEIDAQLAEMQSAEAAKPEESQGEQSQEADKPEVKKVVPLAALHEERRERQRLQAQIAESNRQHAEQMARINERLEKLTTPQKQGPSREEDPVAYLDERIGSVAQQQQQILERDQQREQEAQRQRVINQLTNTVLAAKAEFEKTTPDVGEAAKFMNDMRTRELMALGTPEAQARVQATQELDNALLQWAHQGMNPVQTAYEFAKARGYTPKQAQSAAEKIAAQQKGTAAARSLGGGGAVNAGKLTAEALANMSDEDFSKLTDAQFRQAMGG
jgi:hypothetical protein